MNRRDFLKTSATVGVAVVTGQLMIPKTAPWKYAAGESEILLWLPAHQYWELEVGDVMECEFGDDHDKWVTLAKSIDLAPDQFVLHLIRESALETRQRAAIDAVKDLMNVLKWGSDGGSIRDSLGEVAVQKGKADLAQIAVPMPRRVNGRKSRSKP